MSSENRLHPRAVALLPAEFWLKGGATDQEGEPAMVQDLSAAGAAILTREPLPLQTEVHLRFRLPEQDDDTGGPVEIASVVVRTWKTGSRDARQAYGAGLHFLDLHGGHFERIRVFAFAQRRRT